MTFYGTLASAASWITPKKYFEQVGPEGFKKNPIGLGPYKFVSQKPGIEIVMEANEQYWRKVPSVKRLVFLSVPEGTTRLAMLKRGEVDVAYLLEDQLGESIRNDRELKLVFSGGVATFVLDFFDMWDPKSPWADQRVRKAASLALDRQTMSDTDNLGASKPNGSIIRKNMEFALPIEPDPYDPARARRLLADAGYPRGFEGGDLSIGPPYESAGETIAGYLAAVGIKTRIRTMERAAFFSAWREGKLKGLVFAGLGSGGNAATRLQLVAIKGGPYTTAVIPGVQDLFERQSRELDTRKREELLHQIQRILHERTVFAPIWENGFIRGVGPRVEEPALTLIPSYPYSAPYEDVRLKP
jgi:peptide/nickel transport system substrate-binding protein